MFVVLILWISYGSSFYYPVNRVENLVAYNVDLHLVILGLFPNWVISRNAYNSYSLNATRGVFISHSLNR